MPGKVGSVSQTRYEEIVAEARQLVLQQSRCQFAIGDLALEIEPMRDRGGGQPDPGEELFTVEEALGLFAEDVGIPVATVKTYRWVSARWPEECRQDDVPHGVHRILADIPEETARWEKILHPPLHERSGTKRWTLDAARRVVGHQVSRPVTPQEKIRAIHTLARDEEIAAVVTTDFLRRPAVASQVPVEEKVRAVEELTRDDEVATTVTRNMLHRPEVAFRAMTDDTARHQVNQAQVERSRQAGEAFRRESPVAPAVNRIEHAIEFLDLVGACQRFVTTTGRIVPQLRDRRLSGDEQTVVHRNVDRVKAACEWVETAVDTGEVDLDEELARMLRGE